MLTRRSHLLLALLLLIAGCTAPAGAPGGGAAPSSSPPMGTNGAAVPRIDWRPCGGAFQCATVPVPLDYRNPAGPTIPLGMVRLPALDAD